MTARKRSHSTRPPQPHYQSLSPSSTPRSKRQQMQVGPHGGQTNATGSEFRSDILHGHAAAVPAPNPNSNASPPFAQQRDPAVTVEEIRAALQDSAAVIGGSKLPIGVHRDTGLFIPAPLLAFGYLVRTRYKFPVDWHNEGCTAEITVDERLASSVGRAGSFKTCHPGRIVVHEASPNTQHDAFPVNTRISVAMKRWYVPGPGKNGVLPPAVAAESNTTVLAKKLARVGKEEEEEKLAGEITCSVWAKALMALVYQRIQEAKESAGPDDLISLTVFPEVRFVQCGLFQVRLPTAPKDKTRATRHHLPYLVEELIDTDGHPENFVKYINNGSALPRELSGSEADIAAFLSFCQHLQYLETGGQVYAMGDAELPTGFNGLLTDPQIMTTPASEIPRRLFGDGNVARAFAAFPIEHRCTPYCAALALPSLASTPDQRESPEEEEDREEPRYLDASEVGPVEERQNTGIEAH
ncbi:hypothetical protein CALCODRAFT_545581 [Calocera cornea HHB12733]|uniref:Alpha-type protein kinase domain-containing protein n=1 Tax=Calocera cornea HHB12733 TaxID=1353952 RepID=A0A165JBP5_9BASI|nr:hypothetical protein CALCODRAFT_545581 [Calocera cornea HHB12733]